jgi:hypothetical protein
MLAKREEEEEEDDDDDDGDYDEEKEVFLVMFSSSQLYVVPCVIHDHHHSAAKKKKKGCLARFCSQLITYYLLPVSSLAFGFFLVGFFWKFVKELIGCSGDGNGSIFLCLYLQIEESKSTVTNKQQTKCVGAGLRCTLQLKKG